MAPSRHPGAIAGLAAGSRGVSGNRRRGAPVWVVLCLAASAGTACAREDAGAAGPRDTTPPEVVEVPTSAPPPPLPWSTVIAAATSPQGEYHQVTRAAGAGEEVVLAEEWVAFDVDREMMDRRVALRFDRSTGEVDDSSTRDDPSLQFIYAGAHIYIRHPQNLANCGTEWAEMPTDLLAEQTGLAVDSAEPITTELLALLQDVGDPGPPTHNDDDATTFVVPAPGTTGIQLSTLVDDPLLAERLSAMDQTAQVRVFHDGRPVQVIVDITDAMVAADPRIGESVERGVSVTMRWTLTAPADVDIEVPTDVATLDSCA